MKVRGFDIGPKPRTAYSLLRAVQRLVLADPKRLDMDRWIIDDEVSVKMLYPHATPECGTVGCIAGWCTLVTPLPRRLQRYPGVDAAKVLGATEDEITQFDIYDRGPFSVLFYVNQWPDDLKARLERHTQGTPEYAAVVAERIDRFVTEHRRRLQRTSLTKRAK